MFGDIIPNCHDITQVQDALWAIGVMPDAVADLNGALLDMLRGKVCSDGEFVTMQVYKTIKIRMQGPTRTCAFQKALAVLAQCEQLWQVHDFGLSKTTGDCVHLADRMAQWSCNVEYAMDVCVHLPSKPSLLLQAAIQVVLVKSPCYVLKQDLHVLITTCIGHNVFWLPLKPSPIAVTGVMLATHVATGATQLVACRLIGATFGYVFFMTIQGFVIDVKACVIFQMAWQRADELELQCYYVTRSRLDSLTTFYSGPFLWEHAEYPPCRIVTEEASNGTSPRRNPRMRMRFLSLIVLGLGRPRGSVGAVHVGLRLGRQAVFVLPRTRTRDSTLCASTAFADSLRTSRTLIGTAFRVARSCEGEDPGVAAPSFGDGKVRAFPCAASHRIPAQCLYYAIVCSLPLLSARYTSMFIHPCLQSMIQKC